MLSFVTNCPYKFLEIHTKRCFSERKPLEFTLYSSWEREVKSKRARGAEGVGQ